MKDRIRQIMESLHMSQTEFAEHVGLSTATLSSIYTGRTRPTLATVENIKHNIPNISLSWLMFGTGDMYEVEKKEEEKAADGSNQPFETMLQFDSAPASQLPPHSAGSSSVRRVESAVGTPRDRAREEVKDFDKLQRRVIEIRVFYDDQTWDSFVPSKK